MAKEDSERELRRNTGAARTPPELGRSQTGCALPPAKVEELLIPGAYALEQWFFHDRCSFFVPWNEISTSQHPFVPAKRRRSTW